MGDEWDDPWETDEEELDDETYWDEESGHRVIKFDKGGSVRVFS